MMKPRSFSLRILLALLLAPLLASPGVQPASAVGPAWIPTGEMITPRYDHTATLLPLAGGKVLVAGGHWDPAGAELYDPATGTWIATGSLAVGRKQHTATLLPNGKVLVAGGLGEPGVLASAELYDPVTGTWTSAGSMGAARYLHTATLLPLAGGKVLVTGGANASGMLASAELYDPATNTWAPTGSMKEVREEHTATLLSSGEVLAVGGWDTGHFGLDSAELYDPGTGEWTDAAGLHTARAIHTATPLLDGRVLVAGGWNYVGILASAEIYDPVTDTWTETDELTDHRFSHTATLLPDGKVLVTGGDQVGLYLRSTEVYDPVSGTWTGLSPMTIERYDHAAVLLPKGRVLVTGGFGYRTRPTAELYTSTHLLQSKSSGPQDGWVLESSETSNQGRLTNATANNFIVGDHFENRQYRAILHFNTGALPDNAVITRVVLKIKKHSLTGADPFTTLGKIAIDIRQGAFSQNASLQPTDFQAPASKSGVGVFANMPTPGGRFVARLAAAQPYINRVGGTQLRLRFQLDDDNDAVADFLRFFSGEAAPANRPVLVVEYYVP
jgi:hypothetical protein